MGAEAVDPEGLCGCSWASLRRDHDPIRRLITVGDGTRGSWGTHIVRDVTGGRRFPRLPTVGGIATGGLL